MSADAGTGAGESAVGSVEVGSVEVESAEGEVEPVETFAARARAWLAEQKPTAPPDWGPIMPPERREQGMEWQRRLHEAGFAAIHWPVGYGGQGKGISFFVVDMATPGIECRPLRQMTGGAEFDEVFLTDVRIPVGNLLGPENEGWRVGMTTLTNERGHIGAGTVALERRVDGLVQEAHRAGAVHPVPRDRLAGDLIQAKVLLAMGRRQGPQASIASSLLKLAVAELTVDLADARADRAGMAATLADHPAAQGLVASPGAKLGGGTGEVQRNIIGEMILGLPKEPRPT